MVRRILVAVALVAASTGAAATAAVAVPATEQCEPGVKLSAVDGPTTVSVLDTRTGQHVDVVVAIDGTDFTVTAAETTPLADYMVTDASWCLKAATGTAVSTDTTGAGGASTVVNRSGATQDIGYVTLYSVTTTATTASLAKAGCFQVALGFYAVTDGSVVQEMADGEDPVYLDSGCAGTTFSVARGVSWIWAASAEEALALCGGTWVSATIEPDLHWCHE